MSRPEDLVARAYGGSYARALVEINHYVRREVINPSDAIVLESERMVMLELMALRHREPTAPMVSIISRLRKKGTPHARGQSGVMVVGRDSMQRVVAASLAAGARVPDFLLGSLPEAAVITVVQSHPCSVDRILIHHEGKVHTIMWRRRQTGLVGIIGADPHRPRLLAPNTAKALEIQRKLAAEGRPQLVAAVFEDPGAELTRSHWQPDGSLFVAITDTADDVIALSRMCDQFEALSTGLLASSYRRAADQDPPNKWSSFRAASICATVRPDDKCVSPSTLRLIEGANPSKREIIAAADIFATTGRTDIADSLRRCSENYIIFRNKETSIRETASDYVMETATSRMPLTNFALRFIESHVFRDSGDVYHEADMTFGRVTQRVYIHSSSVDNTSKLEESLRAYALLRNGDNTEQLPTIIDNNTLRRYVVPHFRRQIAELPSSIGADNIGWSLDKQTFYAPGIHVNIKGSTQGPVKFHPGAPALRIYDPKATWPEMSPQSLPTPAADLVAMMLAMCVRFYVGASPRPLCVAQSREARNLVNGIFRELGQQTPHEVNVNFRDRGSIKGVRGYPIHLTFDGHNPEAIAAHGVVLSERGYSVAEEVQEADVEAAGRAFRYSLLRVVEWCLATGAEEFSEQAAVMPHTAYLREGKWLIENVCKIQPWEVTDIGLAHLEGLLAQIEVGRTEDRIYLQDGHVVRMDLSGLECDVDRVMMDIQTLGSASHFKDNHLVVKAVTMMPALAQFYGKAPTVTMERLRD